jgi:ElaB/YqjD/DUF883 family membrane-anchored ribosome-binding protein
MAEKNDSKFVENPERSSSDIRNDIAARRESISQTVGQIGEKIHQSLDWKGYVARYPYAAVGLAVGTGLLIGGLLVKRRSPTERIMDALMDKAEELGDGLRKSARKLIIKTAAPSLFRGTVYGIAGKALMQYLQNRAAHIEGNGGNYSHQEDWREIRRTTSTPPSIS